MKIIIFILIFLCIGCFSCQNTDKSNRERYFIASDNIEKYSQLLFSNNSEIIQEFRRKMIRKYYQETEPKILLLLDLEKKRKDFLKIVDSIKLILREKDIQRQENNDFFSSLVSYFYGDNQFAYHIIKSNQKTLESKYNDYISLVKNNFSSYDLKDVEYLPYIQGKKFIDFYFFNVSIPKSIAILSERVVTLALIENSIIKQSHTYFDSKDNFKWTGFFVDEKTTWYEGDTYKSKFISYEYCKNCAEEIKVNNKLIPIKNGIGILNLNIHSMPADSLLHIQMKFNHKIYGDSAYSRKDIFSLRDFSRRLNGYHILYR